jgi:FkbM family methyltransferase
MQNIFFISPEKPENYPVIDKHYIWVPIHNNITFEEFSELWQKKQPYAIYTYGNYSQWNYLSHIFIIRKKWVHLSTLPEKLDISHCVFSGVLGHHNDSNFPLISVITSTFHSKEKILRPWNSLKSQTYTNWEWVVWDDSKDNLTYGDLLQMKKKDLRMRVYKAPEPSGSIGEMKRLAAGVSYGAFIVELDHDDELHPELFQWIIDASKKYKEADFFYCNTAELFEGTLKSHVYREFFAYGYGSNINVWSEKYNQWITQIDNGPQNPVTLRHLVGLPNHVRAWRTSFYDKIGKHNPRLAVSDDYDLLIRSYIHGKWCHIRKCGYYQYRNADGNFTFIRNSLIQHNIKYIYEHYKSLLPAIPDNHIFQPFWKSDDGQYPVTHLTYDPEPHEYSIILLNATKEKIEHIINLGISFHIYIVGECPDIPVEWRKKVSWWCLGTENKTEKIRYIKRGIATGSIVLSEDELDQIKIDSHLLELTKIQSKLKLKYGTFNDEFPEQLMAVKYLTGNEKVLELGGNIGRNSLIIGHILEKKGNNSLVTLECDMSISEKLKENRDINGMQFHIENAALSKRKLIQKGWNTIVSDTVLEGYKSVNTITLNDLNNKYKIIFDTLIIDCEGAFYYILRDMPDILNNIKLIITENDYRDINHKNYIDTILKENKFYIDYVEKGSQEALALKFPCYLNFYEVWKKD